MAVVTDRKIPLNSTTYTADVIQYTDYSPFGVELDNRHGAEPTGRYRYSFQGQEHDDEIKGDGNSVNYKYRMHDPRIGRFFAVDPLASKYAHNSPYAFSENRVIDGVELEGLEYMPVGKDGECLDISQEGWESNVDHYEWQGFENKETWEYQGQKYGSMDELRSNVDMSQFGRNSSQITYNSENVPMPGTVPNGSVLESIPSEIGTYSVKMTNYSTTSSNSPLITESIYVYSLVPWIDKAKEELGVSEIKGKDHSARVLAYHATTGGFKNDEVPWCSSFVNWTFENVGIDGTNSAGSQSWRTWGQKLGKTPAYGSVGIISHGDGTGHVGFVVGINSAGNLILLGGNQGDMVKYSAFKASGFVGFVYPSGTTPNYNLPIINITGTTSYSETR